MQYNIKGTGLDITDEIRTYVEKKLSAADKFLGNDTSAIADVECEYQELRHGEHYRAEFTVAAKGLVHRVEVWGETLHSAIDLSLNNLLQELRRDKHKRVNVVRRSAARVKDYLRGFSDGF